MMLAVAAVVCCLLMEEVQGKSSVKDISDQVSLRAEESTEYLSEVVTEGFTGEFTHESSDTPLDVYKNIDAEDGGNTTDESDVEGSGDVTDEMTPSGTAGSTSTYLTGRPCGRSINSEYLPIALREDGTAVQYCFVKDDMTFDDADAYCREMNGTLATPETSFDRIAMQTVVSRTIVGLTKFEGAFIGASLAMETYSLGADMGSTGDFDIDTVQYNSHCDGIWKWLPIHGDTTGTLRPVQGLPDDMCRSVLTNLLQDIEHMRHYEIPHIEPYVEQTETEEKTGEETETEETTGGDEHDKAMQIVRMFHARRICLKVMLPISWEDVFKRECDTWYPEGDRNLDYYWTEGLCDDKNPFVCEHA